MRYTKKQYASALLHSLTKTKDVKGTAQRLLSMLRRHKALKHLDEILETAHTLDRQLIGGKKVSIIGVNQSSITEASKLFSEKDTITSAVDPKLTGGILITIDGVRFDTTLRRRFDDLQKTLTT